MKWPMLAALLLSGLMSFAGNRETPAQRDERLRWWREGRFGMFVTWGPVSIEGTEISWSRAGEKRGTTGTGVIPGGKEIPAEIYDNLYKQFNPKRFDAREWVAIARDAGMRYMVLTAKHCDGFCLWDSKVDRYSIGATPFKRDICGELAQAAHRAGMKLGWYYSPMDWRDPDCRTERNEVYVRKMQGHLRELFGTYGTIDLAWFDSEGGPCPWHQADTYALVRGLQPRIIINDRLGIGSGTPFDRDHPDEDADYRTPEQRVGAFDNQHPWETCMTLGSQWAWKPDDTLKTADECIRILVQCITGDGNLLLNVGPMPDGRIEPRQAEVLRQVGAWLRKYGESVYGTRGGPFRNGRWGGSATKGNAVYLHILSWDNDRIELPPLPKKIVASAILAGGTAVKVVYDEKRIVVTRDHGTRAACDDIVRLELEAPLGPMEALALPARRTMEDVSIALADPPREPYAVHDAGSLVDGIRGSSDRLDGKWLGFFDEPCEAVIHFQEEKRLRSVSVGCLQDQASRAFYPTAIEIACSDDGRTYREAGRVDYGEPRLDAEIRPHDFTVSFAPVTARYLKVRLLSVGLCPSWHVAAGSKAWLLVDEIGVQ